MIRTIASVLVLAATVGGKWVAENPALAALFTVEGTTLVWLMMAYGFIASVLPVWVLLCPRDYLSTFLKIGTIVALAAGILVTLPTIHMPALTRFVDGTGPVFAGKLFPFAFITVACGAISGFHALVASGTTPKMVTREGDARMTREKHGIPSGIATSCASESANASKRGRNQSNTRRPPGTASRPPASPMAASTSPSGDTIRLPPRISTVSGSLPWIAS